jgi:hypothetical protein
VTTALLSLRLICSAPCVWVQLRRSSDRKGVNQCRPEPRRLRAARLAAGRRRLPAPLRSFCRLQHRFNKSLSMSGEVSSLVGNQVVSHERSRPADLPRRQDLPPRYAGPYPSHYCSCVSRRALLAYSHRCRNAVTVDGACKRGQSTAPPTRVRSLRLPATDLDFERGSSVSIT